MYSGFLVKKIYNSSNQMIGDYNNEVKNIGHVQFGNLQKFLTGS